MNRTRTPLRIAVIGLTTTPLAAGHSAATTAPTSTSSDTGPSTSRGLDAAGDLGAR